MAITAKGLIQLGFTSEVDFVLQDNSDGAGVFIAEWLSASPQPTVAAIEAAEVEWQTAYDAQAYARNRKAEYDVNFFGSLRLFGRWFGHRSFISVPYDIYIC